MKIKKLLCVMLGLLLVAILCPYVSVNASTSEKISFLKYDLSEHDFVNREVVCNQAIDSSEEVKWETGWYFVRGDVTIDKRVYVEGDVGLILLDGCKLECKGGIEVEKAVTGKDPQIEIYAQSTGDNKGRLIASGDEYGAGIGSDDPAVVYNQDICGDITIHGGYIEATGGNLAAGIGGGQDGKGGSVSVSGGEVFANGGGYASGIGGGQDEKNGTIDVSSDVRLYDNNLKEYIEIPFNKSNLTSYLSQYLFKKNNVLNNVVATS